MTAFSRGFRVGAAIGVLLMTIYLFADWLLGWLVLAAITVATMAIGGGL